MLPEPVISNENVLMVQTSVLPLVPMAIFAHVKLGLLNFNIATDSLELHTHWQQSPILIATPGRTHHVE